MDETYATGDDWVPDFSGDDFAGDKTIMQARREAEAHRQMVNDSIEFIIRELELEESSHRNLKGFAMFRGLEAIITESYRSVENSRLNLTVSLAEYESSYTTAKNRNIGTDLYLFGRMELKARFPRTYICRETIREKIADLFLRRETDFPGHKKFSRRFHVLTQDSKTLEDLLQSKDLGLLIEFPNMEFEIHDNVGLFRHARMPVSPGEARAFVKLTKVLASLFNT